MLEHNLKYLYLKTLQRVIIHFFIRKFFKVYGKLFFFFLHWCSINQKNMLAAIYQKNKMKIR